MVSEIIVCARFFTGLVFLFSGLSKLVARRTFLVTIQSYDFVPRRHMEAVTYAVITIETALGIALTTGHPKVGRASMFLAMLLLLCFTVLVASVIRRGLKVDCGCFASIGRAATATTIWRNLGLVLVAALGCQFAPAVSWKMSVPLRVLAGEGLLLFVLIDLLIGLRAVIKERSA